MATGTFGVVVSSQRHVSHGNHEQRTRARLTFGGSVQGFGTTLPRQALTVWRGFVLLKPYVLAGLAAVILLLAACTTMGPTPPLAGGPRQAGAPSRPVSVPSGTISAPTLKIPAVADLVERGQPRPAEASAALEQGNAHMQRGTSADAIYQPEVDNAIADYDQAIQFNPDYAEAYFARAGAYLAKSDQDNAVDDCNKAIQLKPDYAEAYLRRGNIYYWKKDYDRAFADFDRAIQLKPDLVGAYRSRANAYYAGHDYDRAIADYDMVIRLAPTSCEDYFNRALVFKDQDRKAEAIADLKKVSAVDPNCGRPPGLGATARAAARLLSELGAP